MRGRKKLFILAALLSVILIVSVVFSSGVIDVLTLSLGGSPESSPLASSSTPNVFVDPDAIRKDWVNDPGYQAGNTFEIDVNITDVTDLFSWQINISCDPSMLNVSNIIAGEFLNRVTPPNYTTSSPAPNGLGFVINVTNNAEGYTAMGESILGGALAQSGNGILVTIEFNITGYGYTNLTIITAGGTLPTTLLNSTLDSIGFTVEDGWFDNRVTGDSDGSGVVTLADMGIVSSRWTSPPGVNPYARFADWNDDGVISVSDLGIVSANWGRFKIP